MPQPHPAPLPMPRRDFRRSPLRVALAGAGGISHYHLLAWSRERRAKVTAICDPNLGAARRRAAEFGIAGVYDRLEALLGECPIEAVDIASSRETHAPLVDLAAEHGLPVLCQKPLTSTLAEAEALARRVGGKTRVMVHENWRFRPWYRRLKQWVQAGDLGSVLAVDIAMHSSGLLPDASGHAPDLVRHPYMEKEERLMIAEVLIHHLDVLRWLFGPLRLLDARALHTLRGLRGETMAVMVLETAAGAPVTVRGSLIAPGFPARTEDRLEVVGDKASVRLEGMRLKLLGPDPRVAAFDFARDYQRSFDGAIGHFVGGVIEGSPFETDLDDNLETLRLVEAAYGAAAQRPLSRSGTEP